MIKHILILLLLLFSKLILADEVDRKMDFLYNDYYEVLPKTEQKIIEKPLDGYPNIIKLSENNYMGTEFDVYYIDSYFNSSSESVEGLFREIFGLQGKDFKTIFLEPPHSLLDGIFADSYFVNERKGIFDRLDVFTKEDNKYLFMHFKNLNLKNFNEERIKTNKIIKPNYMLYTMLGSDENIIKVAEKVESVLKIANLIDGSDTRLDFRLGKDGKTIREDSLLKDNYLIHMYEYGFIKEDIRFFNNIRIVSNLLQKELKDVYLDVEKLRLKPTLDKLYDEYLKTYLPNAEYTLANSPYFENEITSITPVDVGELKAIGYRSANITNYKNSILQQDEYLKNYTIFYEYNGHIFISSSEIVLNKNKPEEKQYITHFSNANLSLINVAFKQFIVKSTSDENNK